MQIRSLILTFLTLSIISCTSGVKISSKFCYSQNEWGINGNQSKEYRYSLSGFGIQQVNIRSLLEDNDIRCDTISNLSVEVKRNPAQAVFSFLPGLSAQTIILKFYSFSNNQKFYLEIPQL